MLIEPESSVGARVTTTQSTSRPPETVVRQPATRHIRCSEATIQMRQMRSQTLRSRLVRCVPRQTCPPATLVRYARHTPAIRSPDALSRRHEAAPDALYRPAEAAYDTRASRDNEASDTLRRPRANTASDALARPDDAEAYSMLPVRFPEDPAKRTVWPREESTTRPTIREPAGPPPD